jgi:UDP-N-acetyl-D-mannosaminuronate dehydrogenase
MHGPATQPPAVAAEPEGVDCVVIVTAHPEIDYGVVVARAPLVFDATGVTRPVRGDHRVRL